MTAGNATLLMLLLLLSLSPSFAEGAAESGTGAPGDGLLPYWPWLAGSLALVVVAWLVTAYVIRLNHRLRDTTEALRKELREHEQAERETRRLAAIAEYSSDAVLGIGQDGLIHSVNHAARELYGYDGDHLKGMDWLELSPAYERDRARVHLQACLLGKAFPAWETVRMRQSGEIVSVSITLSPVPGDRDQRGVSSIERDITLQKAAVRKQQEAAKLAEDTARYASIGVIASGITHEINQPLNAISLSSEGMLLWERQNPGRMPGFIYEMAERISEATQRISEIVEHMRSYWVQDNPEVQETVDVKQVLERSLSLLERRISNHQINLKYPVMDQKLLAVSASVSLEQAVNSLVSFAIQALDRSGQPDKCISIQLQESETIDIIVRFNGLLPEVQHEEDLFDPFKADANGFGLALPIARSLLSASRGSIRVDQTNDGECIFQIRLQKA